MGDRFECVRVYDIANDALVYKVIRNGVGDCDYTVKFEILDKRGDVVAINPPVIMPKHRREEDA